MTNVIYWIGLVHVAAYVMAGMALGGGRLIDWLVSDLHLKRDMLRAYMRILQERKAAKKTDIPA